MRTTVPRMQRFLPRTGTAIIGAGPMGSVRQQVGPPITGRLTGFAAEGEQGAYD